MNKRSKHGNLRKYFLVVLSTTTIFAGHNSWSQVKNPTDGQLDEILVTARKTKEKVQNVPESISVISAQTIAVAGVRSIEDFSVMTPNVNINTGASPTYTVLTARGITTPQGAEAPMAIVVDGVQLSDLTFFNVDLLNIDRVEVLRGPQGSLYGRNAIAGAINITTKDPTNDLSGMLRASYANGKDKLLQGVLSGPIVKDKAYFTVAGSYHKSDGTYPNSDQGSLPGFPLGALNRNANTLNSKNTRAALILTPTDALRVAVRFNYTDENFGMTNNELVTLDTLNDSRSHLATNLPLNEYRKLYDGSVKIDYNFGSMALTSVTDRNRARQKAYGDGDFSTLPLLIQDTEDNIDGISQEVRLASTNDHGFRWLVGGYYQHRKTDMILKLPFQIYPFPPLQDSNDKGIRNAFAFFSQESLDLGKFELTVGLRYDSDARSSQDLNIANTYVSKTYHALQPKFSALYHWTEDFQTYATVAKGFRSGGFNASTSTPRQYDQETNWSYELGFKGNFADHRVRMSGALFYTDMKNEQIYFVTTNPPAQNIMNIGKSSKTGMEFEMTGRPTPDLDITVGVGTADGIIKKFDPQPSAVGNKTPQSNAYSFAASIQYRAYLGDNLTLRPYLSYERRGPIYWSADNIFKTPPKDIVNARLFLESDHWSIGAFAKNLTNTRYPTVVGPNAADFSAFGGPVVTLRAMNTPRSYGIEVNANF